jgi:sugar lactone lactonase YvrE
MARFARHLPLAFLLFLAACAAPLGSLQIDVSGLPSGQDAMITVTGPGNYSQTVTGSTTLSALTPGEYTLTTATVRSSDPIVDRLYDPSDAAPTPIEVVRGSNTVTSTYLLRPSSGRLWTPHSSATTTITTGFAAADLLTTGSPPPAATLTGAIASNDGIAFDGAGNAWIADLTADTVSRYEVSELASDGSPSPSVTIEGLSNPAGLAFDAAGNLFVANIESNAIVVFTPDQLLASGTPTPSVTISTAGGSLSGPVGLAFDASGNLWVTNLFRGTIVRFGSSQLASSGTPEPEVTIDDGAGGNLDVPVGVAFDAAGDLWVTNLFGPLAILKFENPGSLSGEVDPTPDVVLTGVTNPAGVVFDNSGSLWVVSFNSGDLLRFDDPGSLSGDVSPAADAVIDGSASIGWGLLARYPPPANLPIVTP